MQVGSGYLHNHTISSIFDVSRLVLSLIRTISDYEVASLTIVNAYSVAIIFLIFLHFPFFSFLKSEIEISQGPIVSI